MRTKSSLRNIIWSLTTSVVTLLAGFIAQRVFIDSLGLERLGINSLFTNIISMLGIAELGLGSAIIYHLYKPISDRDESRIKSLIRFYKNGYFIVALLVTIIGLLLIPALGLIVGKTTIQENIYIIFVLFLIEIVSSYLLTYKRSILYADQRNYLVAMVHTLYIIAMNTAQIAALLLTKDYYLFLGIRIGARLLENIAINIIVNRRYPFLNSASAETLDNATRKDIFSKIKGLLYHKIGAFVVQGTDNIVISIYFGLSTVGLYSNYWLISAGVSSLINQAFYSMISSIGNLLVNSTDKKKTYLIYSRVRFANFWVASVAATGLIVVMDSLIALWVGNQYILSMAVLAALGLNLFLSLIRLHNLTFKEASGIFHEDRFVPIIESIVNLVLSITFLHYFGLAGVLMGTICSNLVLHLFSYPRYVYTKLFERNYAKYYFEFLKFLAIAILIGAVTFGFSRMFSVDSDVYRLAINTSIALVVPNIILYVIFRNSDELKYFKQLIIDIVNKKRKPTLSEAEPQNPIDY